MFLTSITVMGSIFWNPKGSQFALFDKDWSSLRDEWMLLCVSCAPCLWNVWSIVMRIDPDYRPLIGQNWSRDINTNFLLVNLTPSRPLIGWSCPEMNWWPWFLPPPHMSQVRHRIGQSEGSAGSHWPIRGPGLDSCAAHFHADLSR